MLQSDDLGSQTGMVENSSCELPSNICKLQTCAVSAMTVLLTILLSMVLWVQGEIPKGYIQPGPPDFCHKGPFHVEDAFHKDTPSPEDSSFQECLSWQDLSCCTHALTVEIQRHENQGLYNWTYDTCGSLSPECAKYLKVSVTLYVLLTITIDYGVYCYYHYVENSVCL